MIRKFNMPAIQKTPVSLYPTLHSLSLDGPIGEMSKVAHIVKPNFFLLESIKTFVHNGKVGPEIHSLLFVFLKNLFFFPVISPESEHF